MGRIVVKETKWKESAASSTLNAVMEWRDPAANNKILLLETRDMVFYAGSDKNRIIDFNITLSAPTEDVTFGDTKEGAFAIRLADSFTEKRGMKMVDADGRTKMANIWGKRSNWVDYSTDVDGETIGVAIFDHPSNPRHPTYWHARDYGLFALNPFGQKAFDPKQEESALKLPKGQKMTYKWRVVIHSGDAEMGQIADLYKEYASGKPRS
jgi:hypothetical protein